MSVQVPITRLFAAGLIACGLLSAGAVPSGATPLALKGEIGTPDADGDGLTNEQEASFATNPLDPDSDNDGIRDGIDPDIAARVVLSLAGSAFRATGLATAAVVRLRAIQRTTAAGRSDQSVRELQNLRRRLDGCPSVPDPDDWIADCSAQMNVRAAIDLLIANHSSYLVNTQIELSLDALPGLRDGQPRLVGAAVGGQGHREEFVVDEVIFQPESAQELSDFLARYSGTIVRDGRPRLLPGEVLPPGLPETTGWYLIRIDPSRSTLADFVPNMEKAGLVSAWTFSSEDAARVFALAAREAGRHVSPNFLMDVAQQCRICEHPLSATTHADSSTFWWLVEDEDANTPGDQGLSIGVIRAWEYVKYKGYPPFDTPYVPVRLAVIDAGFDLDEATGEALNGNLDYFGTPLQLDEVAGDDTAGGGGYGFGNCNGCWHGQHTFGVSAALSGNSFGTAGTSGGWEVRPVLVKVTGDFDTVATAVYDAFYNGADVISMSIAAECGWACKNFGGGNVLKAAVASARNHGSIVVASAGNEGRDVSQVDMYPCSLDGAVCVGAIEWNSLLNRFEAAGYSNYGSVVDIWAPAGIRTTVTRESAAQDANNTGWDELAHFSGTSCSAPFVAGIVALMKMLDHGLTYEQVRTILWDTANTLADGKVSPNGYVDAYRAVAAVKGNDAPAVTIKEPSGVTSGYRDVVFMAEVTDPESPTLAWHAADFSSTLVFSSSIDGTLCTLRGDATGAGTILYCDVARMTPGTHVISAKATDPFGATATSAMTLTVVNTAPTTAITFPVGGSTYYTSQKINFRGTAYDPDQKIAAVAPFYTWTSDISGVIGTSGDFWQSLPEGRHTITLTVRDELGATGSDSIVVDVQAGAGYPTAQITKPQNNAMFSLGQMIQFQGNGTDPEDGTLPGSSLIWRSSVDGLLGTGTTLWKALSGSKCNNIRHEITLEVTDSDGHKNTHPIVVFVLNLC